MSPNLLRYLSSVILYLALVVSNFIRNCSFPWTLCLCHRSSSLHRNLRRLFRFRAHVDTIGYELNEQNSVIFRRNERRPIRACKARRQSEREGTDTSTNRLNEARGCYSRRLVGTLRGTRKPTMCLECCWNCWRMTSTELVGNWSSPICDDQASNSSLNSRVTNYLGNNHPTIFSSSSCANDEPTFRN